MMSQLCLRKTTGASRPRPTRSTARGHSARMLLPTQVVSTSTPSWAARRLPGGGGTGRQDFAAMSRYHSMPPQARPVRAGYRCHTNGKTLVATSQTAKRHHASYSVDTRYSVCNGGFEAARLAAAHVVARRHRMAGWRARRCVSTRAATPTKGPCTPVRTIGHVLSRATGWSAMATRDPARTGRTNAPTPMRRATECQARAGSYPQHAHIHSTIATTTASPCSSTSASAARSATWSQWRAYYGVMMQTDGIRQARPAAGGLRHPVGGTC